jgi:hypothetical protein
VSISTSTSKVRRLLRSFSVAPWRPSKVILESTRVGELDMVGKVAKVDGQRKPG